MIKLRGKKKKNKAQAMICHDISQKWTYQIRTGSCSSKHSMTVWLGFNIPNENLKPTYCIQITETGNTSNKFHDHNKIEAAALTSGLSVWVAIILLFCGSSLILLTCNRKLVMHTHQNMVLLSSKCQTSKFMSWCKYNKLCKKQN